MLPTMMPKTTTKMRRRRRMRKTRMRTNKKWLVL
jgi:hypothetical protein